MNMTEEIWKPFYVNDYGYISVSNFGNVRNKSGKDLYKRLGKDNYLWVKVSLSHSKIKRKNGEKYFYQQKIHRLVAMSFLDNPNNYPEVNHLDGNKSNNGVKNLEWCTHKQNIEHAVRNNLTKIKLTGSKNPRAILIETDIPEIFRLYKNGTQIASIARKYNVGWSTIQHVIKRDTWLNVEI